MPPPAFPRLIPHPDGAPGTASRQWALPRAILPGLPRATMALLMLALLPALPARAQTFLEQAHRLELSYASLLDLRPGQPPSAEKEGRLELTLELLPVPDIDHNVGGKEEPIDPPGVIPRFRLRRITSWGLMLGATFNPRVEVKGYKALWWGGEIGFRFPIGGLETALRGFFLESEIQGPIVLTTNNDQFDISNRGGDLRVGIPFESWSFYLGGGGGRSETLLSVESDGQRLGADQNYTYGFAGIAVGRGETRFVLEVHRTVDVLDHAIAGISFAF